MLSDIDQVYVQTYVNREQNNFNWQNADLNNGENIDEEDENRDTVSCRYHSKNTKELILKRRAHGYKKKQPQDHEVKEETKGNGILFNNNQSRINNAWATNSWITVKELHRWI